MFAKPSDLALRSLYSITVRESWPEVETWLRDELQETYKALAAAQDLVTVHRLQGRTQFIAEFLKEVRDARANLERRGGSTL